MFTFDYEIVRRFFAALICVAGAVWVAWREHVYLSFTEFSMVGPVMCAIAIVLLLLTALALVWRRGNYSEE